MAKAGSGASTVATRAHGNGMNCPPRPAPGPLRARVSGNWSVVLQATIRSRATGPIRAPVAAAGPVARETPVRP